MNDTNEKVINKQTVFQFLKFTLFSLSAGIIQIGIYALLHDLFCLPYWQSYLPALILSVVWNFTLNRKFTFKSAANIPIAMLKVFAYYCVFTPFSTIGGEFLTSIGWYDDLVFALTLVLNFVTEFLFVRFVVFRNSINTAK